MRKLARIPLSERFKRLALSQGAVAVRRHLRAHVFSPGKIHLLVIWYVLFELIWRNCFFVYCQVSCTLAFIYWSVETRRSHRFSPRRIAKVLHRELVFCPRRMEAGNRDVCSDCRCLWGWPGVPGGQTGRMLDLPYRVEPLRGALVEAEVSCTRCWSLQLLPPDSAAGQCRGDSTPSTADEQ